MKASHPPLTNDEPPVTLYERDDAFIKLHTVLKPLFHTDSVRRQVPIYLGLQRQPGDSFPSIYYAQVAMKEKTFSSRQVHMLPWVVGSLQGGDSIIYKVMMVLGVHM